MVPTISVNNLTKSFGKQCVIDNLSLTIEAGSIYGLVGLNGAGKTTLLRLLLGILRPDSGTISISGYTPWEHRPDFYRLCGVVLESDGFWSNLTAAENCAIYAAARGISPQELKSYLSTYWKDSDLFSGSKKVRHFSRGQRMQCALCRAFMGQATAYLLDEPVIALDLNAYEHFKQLAGAARERGATLIISSHQLDTIDAVCDRVGILRNGSIAEINPSASTRWYLDTSADQSVRIILTTAGATDITMDAGWHFSHPDAENGIPVIVRHLVDADIPVRQVRPEEQGFGEVIRSLYAGISRKEQP